MADILRDKMRYIYASNFRIPYLEDRSPQEKLKKMTTRDKLLYLGVYHKEPYGQVSYTPIGSVIRQYVEDTLREIAYKHNIYEWRPPILMQRGIFEKSGRYNQFKDSIFHIKENENIVVHPTAEEWVADKMRKYELRIHSKKGFIAIYHIAPLFRNVATHRVPIRSKMFNVFVGYGLVKKDTPEKLEKTFEAVLKDVWNALLIHDHLLRAERENEKYVEYFLPCEEGDDIYGKQYGERILNPITFKEVSNNRIRGISIGMYFKTAEIPKKIIGRDMGDVHMYTFGIGLERLIYALFHTQAIKKHKIFDYAVIPLFKPKKEEDYKYIEQMLEKHFPDAKHFLIIDKSKGKMRDKIEYAKVLGIQKVILVGKHEISVKKIR